MREALVAALLWVLELPDEDLVEQLLDRRAWRDAERTHELAALDRQTHTSGVSLLHSVLIRRQQTHREERRARADVVESIRNDAGNERVVARVDLLHLLASVRRAALDELLCERNVAADRPVRVDRPE